MLWYGFIDDLSSFTSEIIIPQICIFQMTLHKPVYVYNNSK